MCDSDQAQSQLTMIIICVKVRFRLKIVSRKRSVHHKALFACFNKELLAIATDFNSTN